ncbi:MAG: UDP-N-acetylmuramoyl-tripeptide--D-alanyl-D-alanine ligase [Desulfobacterales bacterium]|nr:MAG: UDP-N-acetylmuramoyl-tripeptide--D-alanyl-D-alanine ligase [Desulfobacterales bacterium]
MTHPLPWTTQDILDATRGRLLCGDLTRRFAGVSIDSRRISAEDLFVAIIGQIHDGHTFAGEVVVQGVNGLVVNDDKVADLPLTAWQKKNIVCVGVADTTQALGALAAANRRRTTVSVAAITGSNGKTATRRMTAGVLERKFNTLATIGNLNNEIGLPLTLLQLGRGHQWAVVELGMNHPGEIAVLGDICAPDIGLITNIGPAHLEGLGSVEGVMHAKGELLEKIRPLGKAVLNADDALVLKLAARAQQEVVLFGSSPDATVRAQDIQEKPPGVTFTLVLPEIRVAVRLKTPGRFMVSNALAAAAVGYLAGLTANEIKSGLEAFTPAPGRLNVMQTANRIHIIDDTYNANPSSMEAAIGTLTSLRGHRRGILVAGDMRELGEQAPALHTQIGAAAARSGIARLYVTGEFAACVAAGANAAQMHSRDIFTGSREAILQDLKNWLEPEDWVLVKGSRAMEMEKIVQGIKEWGESVNPITNA